MRVLKFGGTSVADAGAFDRAVQIVREFTLSPVVVVVSAMSGITDALISANRDVIENHLQRHCEVAESLDLNNAAECRSMIETARREIATLLNSDIAEIKIVDAIAAYGEMLCARLLTMILEQRGISASYVDARRCIVTDDTHGNANPLIGELTTRTRAYLDPLLKKRRVPVLGGVIRSTLDGVTTTMGRGSSDYSATLIGAALGADEIQIWAA